MKNQQKTTIKKQAKRQNKVKNSVGESKSETQTKPSNEADLIADLQRIQAEFINFKKRSEEEKTMLSHFSKAQVIKDLLPVIDDLERALAHLPDDLSENKWAQGVSKVYERLKVQLEKLGVSEITALNQSFDPNYHEAVMVEGEGDHQVVSEVLQKGYQVEGNIIRHAIVKVVKS